ncbi:nucleotidyl transferase AbiEii/AbiGii toxin family protein [Methylomagnum sp.]
MAIPVASIPGMAILKLFAWIDRGQENPKDALDLVALLRCYHEAGNQERVYTDALSALERVGHDIELGGAWLLGHDAAAIASRDTRDELRARLADARLMDRLAADMARVTRGAMTPSATPEVCWSSSRRGSRPGAMSRATDPPCFWADNTSAWPRIRVKPLPVLLFAPCRQGLPLMPRVDLSRAHSGRSSA